VRYTPGEDSGANRGGEASETTAAIQDRRKGTSRMCLMRPFGICAATSAGAGGDSGDGERGGSELPRDLPPMPLPMPCFGEVKALFDEWMRQRRSRMSERRPWIGVDDSMSIVTRTRCCQRRGHSEKGRVAGESRCFSYHGRGLGTHLALPVVKAPPRSAKGPRPGSPPWFLVRGL